MGDYAHAFGQKEKNFKKCVLELSFLQNGTKYETGKSPDLLELSAKCLTQKFGSEQKEPDLIVETRAGSSGNVVENLKGESLGRRTAGVGLSSKTMPVWLPHIRSKN